MQNGFMFLGAKFKCRDCFKQAYNLALRVSGFFYCLFDDQFVNLEH